MRAAYSLLVVGALAACDRPRPLVICHNTNCASPDARGDDTLKALGESFALTYDGRSMIDGMEWDTFWHGAKSRCLFAHDLNGDITTTAAVAARAIADHLASTDAPAWNGERFYAFIELKGFVGHSFTDAHTPEQRDQHADCALDTLQIVMEGARARGHQVTAGFIAGVPALHEALVARPGWQQLAAYPDLELMLIGDIFGPYSSLVPALRDFELPLDAVEYHPDYMTQQHHETYRSLGIQLVQWSFVTSIEALDAIERWEPAFVITNEAPLLRQWIAR